MSAFKRLLRRLGIGEQFTPATATDFTATPSQKDKRPLKADGQAHLFARLLLSGYDVSHQEFVRALKRRRMVSNSPQRRMSEARKWLRDHGVTVSFGWYGSGSKRHKVWFIEKNIWATDNFKQAGRKLGVL